MAGQAPGGFSFRRKNSFPTANEAGVSALEFALVLPLIVILITGVVQLGNAYHQLQVLHEALRQGARVAVDLSKPAPAAVACASLSNAAKTASREYLHQSGLYPDTGITDANKMPWTISVKSIPTTARTEGGVTVYFIEMSGQKNSKVNSCLFCANGFLANVLPSSKASFAIRGTCS